MRSARRFFAGVLTFALTFSAVPAFGSSYLSSMEFTDSSHGYLTGWYGKSPGSGFVSVTDDGGLTWHATATGWGSPVSVSAENASTASVVDKESDLLLSTENTGVSWTRTNPLINVAPVPAGVGSPTFSDIATSSAGYVAVGRRQGATDGDFGIIYTSADGVTGWTSRFRTPPNPPTIDPVFGDVIPGAPTYARFDKVSFAPGGSVGWAIGAEWKNPNYAATSASFKRLLIYKTVDGGLTWAAQTIPARGAAFLYNALSDIVAIDSTHANAVGPGRESMRTTDGTTWVDGEITRVPGLGPYLDEVWGVDAMGSTVVAVGRTNSGISGIWWSTDGGVTWPNYQILTSSVARLRSVQLITPTRWIVVGDEETIARTENAGATWTFTTAKAPTITVSPTVTLGSSSTDVTGTAADIGAGVASVDITVRRSDGKYWNATAGIFDTPVVWNHASTSDGWRTWSWNWAPGGAYNGAYTYALTARATDAIAQTAQATPSTVPGAPSGTVERIPGADRYVVASILARKGWDPTGTKAWTDVKHIVIANGESGKEADPLTAAGLAGAYNAPVLVVQYRQIPASIKSVIAEIAKSNPGVKIHIVGGTGSVPDARWNDIKKIAGVSPTYDRIAGSDRYVVSANIANRIVAVAGAASVKGFILIAADNTAAFYDALAVSPIAYANTMPMLAVRKTYAPPSVKAILNAPSFATTPRYAASSTGYIAAPMATYYKATRMSSTTNRYTAASQIATFALAKTWLTPAHTGLTAKTSDALTGGAFLGEMGGVMLFTDSTSVMQSASRTFITAHKSDITNAWVIGGSASVPDAQMTSFVNLLK